MSDVETKMAFRARAQVQRKRKLSAVFGLGQEGLPKTNVDSKEN